MKDKLGIIGIILIVILSSLAISEDESDFDNDDMPDAWEKANNLRFDIFDADEDPDNDGLNNLQEYRSGTDPHEFTSKKVIRGKEKSAPNTSLFTKIFIYAIIFIALIIIFMLRHKILALFIKPKVPLYNYPRQSYYRYRQPYYRQKYNYRPKK